MTWRGVSAAHKVNKTKAVNLNSSQSLSFSQTFLQYYQNHRECCFAAEHWMENREMKHFGFYKNEFMACFCCLFVFIYYFIIHKKQIYTDTYDEEISKLKPRGSIKHHRPHGPGHATKWEGYWEREYFSKFSCWIINKLQNLSSLKIPNSFIHSWNSNITRKMMKDLYRFWWKLWRSDKI